MMVSSRLRTGVFALALLLLALPTAAADKILVLTALQSTYSIASALAKDTAIEVQAGFPADIGMDQQSAWLSQRQRRDFIAAAKRADAVVTIRKVWSTDPLFPAARALNIRVVEIDASTPFAPELAGVALVQVGKDGVPVSNNQPGTVSPYIWLNPINAVRMTDIIAADLRRLSEADAATIDRNQQVFRAQLIAMKAGFDAKLAEIDDPSVISLSSDLAYLTTGLGVDVAAFFPKSDYDWTDADAKALIDKMKASKTVAVIAPGKPKESVAAAIAAAGGHLAILNMMDPAISTADGKLDPDGLIKTMRGNLDQILAVLKP
jgi:ABC-type Zn uptake system ZnuABC Zn-binding protein ZnuA